jgi:predicted nucleic acid-binding protein
LGMTDLPQRIRACSVIAVDTVTFIYHFEDNPTYARLTELIFADIEVGVVEAVASTIAFAEVLTGAKKAKNDALALKYRAIFANFPHLLVAPVDMQVAEKVAEMRSHYGLRMPDAITVATALVHHAQALVTNDRDLRRVTALDVIVLADFVGV